MLTVAVLEPMAWPHPCGKHDGSAELRRLEILFKLGLFTNSSLVGCLQRAPVIVGNSQV